MGKVFASLFYGLLFEIKVCTLSAVLLLSFFLWQSLETLQVLNFSYVWNLFLLRCCILAEPCRAFTSCPGQFGSCSSDLPRSFPHLLPCPLFWDPGVQTLLITPSCTHLNPSQNSGGL